MSSGKIRQELMTSSQDGLLIQRIAEVIRSQVTPETKNTELENSELYPKVEIFYEMVYRTILRKLKHCGVTILETVASSVWVFLLQKSLPANSRIPHFSDF